MKLITKALTTGIISLLGYIETFAQTEIYKDPSSTADEPAEDLHGVARAGVATVFPQTIGMAATFDPNAVYTTFDIVSTEQRAKYNEGVKNGDRPQYTGLTVWTPNINIFRDSHWGRGVVVNQIYSVQV